VLIYSVLASGVFFFLGLPAPILLGIMAACFSCAPYVGPTITTAVLLVVTMAAPVNGYSPHWMWGGSGAHVIGSVVTYIAYDQLYGTFILPRIAGKAVGVHIFVGFFAIAAGGTLFGLPGIILAYPVAGSIRVVLERILNVVVDDRPKQKVRLPRVPLRFRATTG
jgi:predicted PurR-regulated permease PerM